MSNYSEEKIKQVWKKAKPVPIEGNSNDLYRKDEAEAWIYFDYFGKEIEYGWTIDHILPKALGGTDHIDNLLPLHWENNKSKANDFPKFKTIVTSENNKNIKKEVNRYFTNEYINKLKLLYPNNENLNSL